jgi:uncharacterized protein YkwD
MNIRLLIPALGTMLSLCLAGCPTTGSTATTGVSVIPDSSDTSGDLTPTLTGTAGDSVGSTDSNVDFSGCITPAVSSSLVNEVLVLVNQERAAVGEQALTINTTLNEQAGDYACELIAYDFFAHENPVTGSTLATRTADSGYQYLLVGENLAAGQPTAAEAMEGWMNSEGHRENILRSDYEEIGIAVREGGDYGIYWVQVFGKPR